MLIYTDELPVGNTGLTQVLPPGNLAGMQEISSKRNPLAGVFAILERQERTQAWLARKIGIDRSYLTNIAKGRRRLTRTVIDGCAKVLAVPAEILFDARDLPNGNDDEPEGKAA